LKPKSHSFEIEDAKKYGVPAAIFLHHMKLWIQQNRENKDFSRHFRDDRWWTYNSRTALAKIFPYWTPRQIRGIIEKLETAGAIITAQLGGGNRSNWYAFEVKNPLDQTDQCPPDHRTKKANGASDEKVQSSDEKVQSSDEKVQPSDEKVQCIKGTDKLPDKLPDEIPDRQGFSQRGLSERENDEKEGFGLLLRFGVARNVAHSLAFIHHTPLMSIYEVIKNGLAKQRASGGLWKLKGGYMVAALNQARSEGKIIGPTKASEALRKKLNISRPAALAAK